MCVSKRKLCHILYRWQADKFSTLICKFSDVYFKVCVSEKFRKRRWYYFFLYILNVEQARLEVNERAIVCGVFS